MRRAAFIALVAGACGDNGAQPFLGNVEVSAPSTPFTRSCSTTTSGVLVPNLEVEPSLAIDPADEKHLVAAWQQDRWSSGGANGVVSATSRDGGLTWMRSTAHFGICENGTFLRVTDGYLAITPSGRVYEAALGFDPGAGHSGVMVARSDDGGDVWHLPALLQEDTDVDVFNDKEAITADPLQPDTVYVVWDRLTGLMHPNNPDGTGPTLFARGTGGVFEPTRTIIDPGPNTQTIGNQIVVLPDGTLVNAFDLISNAAGTHPTQRATVSRSTDHGDTWSDPIDLGPMQPDAIADEVHGLGFRTGSSLTQVAVDPTSGRLYVAWEDGFNNHLQEGIVVTVSADGGLTWSKPAHVEIDGGAGVCPTIAVAPDGTVGVLYYSTSDSNPDGTNFVVSAYLATSADGGQTWAQQRVAGPFDPGPAAVGGEYFFGDYEGLVGFSRGFVPLFSVATGGGDPGSVIVRPE